MVYVQPKHKCLSCYYEIHDGQEEGFIREHSAMRFYHINWRDCQAAMRNDRVVDVEEMQDA